jgi:hypothetical protein
MTAAWLEPLSEERCLALLRQGSVGRLAVVVDGGPLILPVNYRLVEPTSGPSWQCELGSVMSSIKLPRASHSKSTGSIPSISKAGPCLSEANFSTQCRRPTICENDTKPTRGSPTGKRDSSSIPGRSAAENSTEQNRCGTSAHVNTCRRLHPRNEKLRGCTRSMGVGEQGVVG